MRTVHVVNSLAAGGAERLLLDLTAALRGVGVESRILTLAEGELDYGDVSVDCLGLDNIYTPAAGIRLARRLKTEEVAGADLFHVHLFPSLLHVSLAGRMGSVSVPLVYTEHHTTNRRRGKLVGRMLDMISYPPYSRVVCVSGAVRESLTRWMPRLASRTVVIHNGIDVSKFSSATSARPFGETPSVVTVGRLRRTKGTDLAIRAVAELGDVPLRMRIVGEGPMRSRLEALSRQLGLSGRVEFLGSRDDVPSILADADVLLHTSGSEGFGLVVLEAMAAGVPVVCTDLPAVREITGPACEGAILCPPRVEEYASVLRRLLESPSLREETGREGALRARKFDIGRKAEEHADLYRRVLSGG